MSGNSTVLAAGSVTVSTTGYQSGALLARLSAQIAATNAGAKTAIYDSATEGPSLTLAPTSVPAIFAVGSGSTVTLNVDAGGPGAFSPNLVLASGTNVTVTGGDSNTAVASQGLLNYSGNAGTVDAFGDNSTVNATLANARVAAGGNDMAVTLGADNQSLALDYGTTGTFTETGSGDAIQVGGGQAPASPPPGPSVSGADSVGVATLQLTSGNAVSLGSSSVSSVLVLHGGSNTISATATGSSSIFAQGGADVYYGNAASTYFVGATTVAAVSTVFGGAGNDTVFGASGVNYTAGAGDNVFISGLGGSTVAAAHSTVTASTGHDTLFGSAVGDQVNLGQGSEFFVGGGGADTLFGGSITPTVFGNNGENLRLIGTKGAIATASGDKDTIDGSLANQGSTFFAVNYPGVGNTTLVGSLAAPTGGAADAFVVGSVSGGGGAAHTITIDNFQTGDSFFLQGYSAADDAVFAQTVANNPKQGGGLSVTLSDKTTVTFVNTHPTATFGGGTQAL